MNNATFKSVSLGPSQQQISELIEHFKNRRFDEAEKLAVLITQKFPEHPFAWKILGVLFGQTGRKSDALNANQKAVALSPQDALAHNNLGTTLKELGKLEEAEVSYRQATLLKSDYALAHNNLGTTLKELGKLEEAEASYRQATLLKSDYAEAHNNLGTTLKELGKLEEAEVSYRQAIVLKPDYAEAHSSLGCIMYEKRDMDSATYFFKKAFNFDSNLRINELRLMVLKSRKTHGRKLAKSDNLSKVGSDSKLQSNPLILSRAVETELTARLYEMTSRTLDKTNDARYGNGSCSLNFQLFKDESSIIKTVSSDLIRIMGEAVKSKIYVYDSFFNILGAGGGSHPHNHLKTHDDPMRLWKQKYSLVYYLSVGDQNCSEPGILKLYDPSEDILPSEGMITIIPASRDHSAVYGGKKDRVMIGVNFYSL